MKATLKKQALRVVTYNLHKGMNTFGTKIVLERIKNGIAKLNADVVFLQEIQGDQPLKKYKTKGGSFSSQLEFLADEIWEHHAYAKNAVFQDSHHGNAILSRFPIVDYENINLTTNRFEKRGLLHAICEDPETKTKIDLLCVHIDLTEQGRRKQIGEICERIDLHVDPSHPMLMCGDFNDWSLRTAKIINDSLNVNEAFLHFHGRYARTFPSFMPLLRLDRIYYRNLNPIHAHVLKRRPWNQLSDHVALLADFSVPL